MQKLFVRHRTQRYVEIASLLGAVLLAVCTLILYTSNASGHTNQLMMSMTTSDTSLSTTTAKASATTNSSSKSAHFPGITGASKALIRIGQAEDRSQYGGKPFDFDTWWPSSCSATSMTEVIDAYESLKVHGQHYRIIDILRVESGLGEITPQDGLLHLSGIDRTLAHFGYQVNWLNDSISEIISIANAGQPLIINFPPPASGGHWAGGHFLVVVGGNSQYVFLADSSKLNMQAMKIGSSTAWGTFAYYWTGIAGLVQPVS